MLTESGTAAMEAAVLNFLDASDRAIVINGGTFGQRWCDLCDIHSIAYDEIKVAIWADLDLSDLHDRLSGFPLSSDDGVFVFMLSAAIGPECVDANAVDLRGQSDLLWTRSHICTLQRGRQLHRNQLRQILTTTGK